MKKKLQLAAVAGLVAVVAVGGTFAYFNETMSIDNPFNTGKYSTTMEEVFTPKDDWRPGVEVNKDVIVKNTGDQPVVVRVKFDEEWTRKGENTAYKTVAFNDKGNEDEWKIVNAYQAASKDAQNNDVAGAVDGIVTNDDTVVTKNIDTTNWILGSDGWYYYIDVVEKAGAADGKDVTKKILDSVTLIKDADMGQIDTTITYSVESDDTNKVATNQPVKEKYISTDANGEKKVDIKTLAKDLKLTAEDKLTTTIAKDVNETNKGYSSSDYKLKITSQTVQATDTAIKEIFELVTNDVEITGLRWLTVSEENGVKTYTFADTIETEALANN